MFSWSVPFLCDCVTKMFYALLSRHNQIYDEEKEKEALAKDESDPKAILGKIRQALAQAQQNKQTKVEVIKHKIRAVGRIGRLFGIRK